MVQVVWRAFRLSYSWHKLSQFDRIQRISAGLPLGIPGIEDDMLGAIQQAPQPKRQSISYT